MADSLDEMLTRVVQTLVDKNFKIRSANAEEGDAERTVELRIEQKIDHDLLTRARDTESELETVLFLSFEIEFQLRQFLQRIIGTNLSGDFAALTRRLEAIRHPENLYEIVNGFAKLRNRFAHSKNAKLDDKECQKILEEIYAYPPPSIHGTPIDSVKNAIDSESIAISELKGLDKLSLYGQVTAIYLAAADHFFTYPAPHRKFTIQTKKNVGFK
ncbi:MAG: hypothetical protein WBD01_02580 [Salaquimonas sp.]